MIQNTAQPKNNISQFGIPGEFLLDFYNNSPVLMCILGLDGCIEHINPAFYKTIGYKEEELVGKHYFKLIQKKDRERVKEELKNISANITSLNFKIRTKCKNGKYKWLSWTGYSNAKGYIYAIGNDISEDKKLFDELNYQKEIFKAVFDHIPLLITFYNSKGEVIAANWELERVLGWTSDDLQKIDVIKESFPNKTKRAEVINFIKKTVPEWKEFEIKTKFGNFVTISWYNIRLSDGSNLSIGKDVTELKKSDVAKKEFLSAVSHELKAPITTLKLMCETFKRRYEMRNMKAPESDFRIIQQELDRLTRLIDDLLDLSRFENGKLNYRFEAVKINSLLEDVVKKVEHLSPRHNIELVCDEDREVLVDIHRIEQVLTNLVTNAFKFSLQGKTIIVKCINKRKNVIIAVKDFGIGIPKPKQKYIFDRFYQIDKSNHKGFGLGLYISKEIIEQHKGKIWVESRTNKGSVFYLKLPVLNFKS